MGILEQIKDHRGLRRVRHEDIGLVCAELRKKIIDVTLKNGGHLGASLGAVELIVALLRAYSPDSDKIIFDVGHQAYAYKILTGRLGAFDTLRTKGGIAGFPRMGESPYDFFTTGHSSTSISAAIGYAKARDLRNERHEVIAVIGDGSLLNGEAFEALNYMEHANTKVIIILNDNAMSISPRVGGLAGHLARLAVSPSYRKLKDIIKKQCRAVENGGTIENKLARMKSKLKSLLLPTNIFEEMSISYWGPFDGHDERELEEVFKLARTYDKPLLIHVMTRKGKGFTNAEANPSLFHGISPNSDPNGAVSKQDGIPTWSAVFGGLAVKLAESDRRIAALTAAMTDGTKLTAFAKRYPERFFDVGIAEEHMMTYAAGLAAGGLRPVVCVYSTFLQRAIDQIVHDICQPKLPILIGIDRAGFVGEDGETHHGLLDIPWLKSVPELVFAAPRDAVDLEYFVNGWHKLEKPMAIRYPRGSAPRSLARPNGLATPAPWGKLEILREGRGICLIGLGSTVSLMLEAAGKIKDGYGIDVTVADLRFIRPMDMPAVERLLSSHELVITAEEGMAAGGVGEAIAARASSSPGSARVIVIGAPDRYIPHATRDEQLAECGLTAQAIVAACGLVA